MADGNTTVLLRRKTRERLRRLGVKGETYDDILDRLATGAEAGTEAGTARRRGPSPRRRVRLDLAEWGPLD